ncbi:MAG: hypothetical protein ACW98D_13035, partial [Promethearchaeota archaeon]
QAFTRLYIGWDLLVTGVVFTILAVIGVIIVLILRQFSLKKVVDIAVQDQCEIMDCNERAKSYIRLKRKYRKTDFDKKPIHVCKVHRKMYIKNRGYKDTDSPAGNAMGICYGIVTLIMIIVGVIIAIIMVI